MDGWNTFLLGWPIFTGDALISVEGSHPKKDTKNCQLVGGISTHLNNMRKSNWIISPRFGVNKNQLLSSSTHLLHPVQSLTAPCKSGVSGPTFVGSQCTRCPVVTVSVIDCQVCHEKTQQWNGHFNPYLKQSYQYFYLKQSVCVIVDTDSSDTSSIFPRWLCRYRRSCPYF